MVTLRQAAQLALEALARADKISGHANNRKAINVLRQALEAEQQLDKPMAEIWWDDSKGCDWQLKMLVEPAVARGVRIPLYAGDYEAMPVMYVNRDGSFTVKAPALQPLTIRQMADAGLHDLIRSGSLIELVRAVERMHHIK